MKIAQSVAGILPDHVTLEVEGMPDVPERLRVAVAVRACVEEVQIIG